MEPYMYRNRQRADWVFGGEDTKKPIHFTLAQVVAMPENEFEDFYVPEVEEMGNGTFLKTHNRRHTMTDFYEIRYVWFDLRGNLDQGSLYPYFEMPKVPMYMWRIVLDKHTAGYGYMTPSYYIKTDSIYMTMQMGKDKDTEQPKSVYVFENEVFDREPDLLRKMSKIINEIAWPSF